VCLAADALLAISLIPVIGLWGAVTANAASQLLSLGWMTSLVARRLGLGLRHIVRAMPLFALGAVLGAVEAVICLPLRGWKALLVVPVVLLGLVLLRICLLRFRSLRLRKEDVAQLQRASSGRLMRLLLRALGRAGVTEPGQVPINPSPLAFQRARRTGRCDLKER
jgi:hypothetical protein